jgi:hypothetical protein
MTFDLERFKKPQEGSAGYRTALAKTSARPSKASPSSSG